MHCEWERWFKGLSHSTLAHRAAAATFAIKSVLDQSGDHCTGCGLHAQQSFPCQFV